ncbi:MAG: 6-bladed beta-propeller [Bacteroidales bacterium]|jgi:hypothetical protein
MKKINFFVFVCVLIIFLDSCGSNRDYIIPLIDVGGTEIADLDPDLLTPFNVNLSQIAENLHYVAIETKIECMLSAGVNFQIGNKYIIAEEDEGIYQYSVDGSYIRKLVSVGRGPEEVSFMGVVCLVEPEDMLMVVSKDYDIHYYRLSSGEFLGSRGKPYLNPQEVLRHCKYIGDSTILYSYSVNGLVNPDLFGCGVRIQRLSGEVIWQHEFNYNSFQIISPDFKFSSGSRINLLKTNDKDEYILQVDDQDTVYKLNTSTFTLRPDFIKRIEKIKVDGIPVGIYANNCTVETEEFARVNGYQLLNYVYVKEVDFTSAKVSGDRYFVIYDSNNNTAYRIGVFENDYFGFSHATEGDNKTPHYFPILLNPNGKLVMEYDSFTFLSFAGKALANPRLDETVRFRLLEISNKITETSNPILLIGDIKEKIDL